MSATPILDLECDPPVRRKRWWTRGLPLLIGAAIGLTFSAVDWSPPDSWPGFNLLFWFLGIYVTIAIHELAHLGAGMWRGIDPGGLIVGGFQAMRSGDRWTFRFHWRQLLMAGGMAVPMSTKDTNVADFVWMIAAGPVASVVCTTVLWMMFVRFGSGTWDWIGSFFWGSLLGITSLIPMSGGMNKSDAARIIQLLLHPDQGLAWMATVAIRTQDSRGIRPRDWDAVLFERMISAPRQDAGRVLPDLRAYCRQFDQGDEAGACIHLENALAASAAAGKVMQQILYSEASIAAALIRKNPAQARTWRDRALKLRKPETRASVDAAIAFSEGRFEDALPEIRKARDFMAKRKLKSGLAVFAGERLNELERSCEEATLRQ